MGRLLAKVVFFLALCAVVSAAVAVADRDLLAGGSVDAALRQMSNDPAAPAAVQTWSAVTELLTLGVGALALGFGLFLFWPELTSAVKKAKELSRD